MPPSIPIESIQPQKGLKGMTYRASKEREEIPIPRCEKTVICSISRFIVPKSAICILVFSFFLNCQYIFDPPFLVVVNDVYRLRPIIIIMIKFV